MLNTKQSVFGNDVGQNGRKNVGIEISFRVDVEIRF